MSMLMRRAFMGNPPPPPVYATWNPSDKGTGITLSNGNLTVTSSASGTVRSTIGKSSGKWYWEDNCDNVYCCSGAASLSLSINSNLYGQSAGFAYISSSGECLTNSVTKATYATTVTNDKVGFALDMDAGTLSIYKNGVLLGTPFTGLTGTMYAATNPISANFKVTTNFGATAFAYPPPGGYNAGLYV